MGFTKIPALIEDNEIIIRGILKPLLFKKKLTDSSFLPPPKRSRKDVSVLRHKYLGSDKCKKHAASLKIAGNNYHGLAIILCKSIKQEPPILLENGEVLSVDIKSTPLENLEAHADILYSHNDGEDEPQILMRKIARNLIKHAIFLEDPSPDNEIWCGQNISEQLFLN